MLPIRALMRRLLAVMLGLVVLPGTAAATAAAAPGRIIVQRAPGLTAAQRGALHRDAGVQAVQALRLPSTEVVRAARPQLALQRLRRDPDVVYAELDRSMHVASATTYLATQWALDNTADPAADMNVPSAWSLSTGTGVTVGVVDTGIATHLGIPSTQVDPLSRSFLGGDATDYADANGHGTFIAGQVASRPHDGAGTAGVAPDARVAALRAFDADGNGSFADVANALDYAGDQHLPIVNASFNGPASTAVENAIASHPGTLFVVAAGNAGTAAGDVGADDDAVPSYPCSLALDNVLCVGASDARDQPSPWSNHGRLSVDLYAPGDHIESTWLGDAYGYLDGTSMAAGNVAAEAALVLAAAPGLSAHDLKEAILQSGDPLAALAPLSATGRRADAYGAVALAQSGPIPADADEDGIPDATDPTPRGDDADGDGVARLDDACPTVAGTLPDGCPAPVAPPAPAPAPAAPSAPAAPAPTVTVSTPVTTAPADLDGDGRTGAADACPAEAARTADGCPLPRVRRLAVSVARRSHRVTASVRADRAATVALSIVRRRCARGHCRWVRVARRTAANRTAVTLRRRLAAGRYRAVVTLRSGAGRSRPARRAFSVR